MGLRLAAELADPSLGTAPLPTRGFQAVSCLQSAERSSGQLSAHRVAWAGNEIILFKRSPARFLGEILAMENIE